MAKQAQKLCRGQMSIVIICVVPFLAFRDELAIFKTCQLNIHVTKHTNEKHTGTDDAMTKMAQMAQLTQTCVVLADY